MSLRRAFLVFAAGLGFLGLIGAGGLIVFTTALHRITANVENTVESVRITEEFEIELLSHRGTQDNLALVATEGRLRQHLADAARFVGSAQEQALLTRMRSELDAYIEASDRDAVAESFLALPRDRTASQFEALLASSGELVRTNVEQSRELRRLAAAWDRKANILGTAIIVILIGGLVALALFVRRAVFGPAVSIAAAVERYSKGERASRAPEHGAAEFRNIAFRFNDMASTIEHQREQQMTFLAGVAHDLRNPLSVLKLAGGLISPQRPLPPEGQIRESWARIRRQIERLERMVSDFLDTASIEAGTLELQVESADLTELARATIQLFEPTAPAHRLSLSAPRDAVLVACDPMRIEQVLNNLVSNAIKYSPRGGEVRVVIEHEDEAIVLTVRDEGVGISLEDLGHLFEAFRRTSTARASAKGVGLGLFVARRIVESHGGRLTVESAPGKGSTFRVEFPARPSLD